MRDGSPDHDGDVRGVGRAQRLDGPGGQRQVGTGQNAQAHDRHVLLHRDRGDVFDALPDARVDHLETGVAQGAGDDLRPAVVAVEAGLGYQDADGH